MIMTIYYKDTKLRTARNRQAQSEIFKRSEIRKVRKQRNIQGFQKEAAHTPTFCFGLGRPRGMQKVIIRRKIGFKRRNIRVKEPGFSNAKDRKIVKRTQVRKHRRFATTGTNVDET